MKHFCEINQFNYGSFRVMMIGKYKPSPEMALRIEKATNGKVDRLELLYPNAKD
jgi:DNA-binding transcriptional regulator YdaS (Cro superfamily)